MNKLLLFLSSLIVSQYLQASYLVKERISLLGETQTLAVSPSDRIVSSKTILREINEFLSEDVGPNITGSHIYRESLVPDEELSLEQLSFLNSSLDVQISSLPNLEIRDILVQGPAKNRINLPILAEGYTLEEKEKFFEDARRITEDLFGHKAFASYLSLFNVYAIFVSSNQSGVSDTNSVDTAFESYRTPRGSKRAIIPGNTRAIENALSFAPGADYPILLVNDDYYGGLGGRYAVTTRSFNSGSMVLRHELGHNFGEVGEEYDGGQVYSGANFSSSSSNLKWNHWLTNSSEEKFDTLFLEGAYIWQNLTNRDVNLNFRFPEGNYLLELMISSVGWSNPDEVEISLDGERIEYQGVFTDDRSFFSLPVLTAIEPGPHRLSIVDKSKDGDNILAFANVYAQPANIVTSHEHIGAYAVFDSNQRKRGYRPSYETCIMRNMRSDEFCSVDIENMWHKFLGRIKFVDGVELVKESNQNILKISAINLTGLRFEVLDSRGNSLAQGTQREFKLPADISSGQVKVIFQSSEVRNYSRDFVQSFRF